MFEKPYHGIHIFVKRKFGTFGKARKYAGLKEKIFLFMLIIMSKTKGVLRY